MKRSGHDLTGVWDGEFDYPDVPEAGPRTPFLATIADKGGVISGSVIEPHELQDGIARATILGQRIGRSVHFAKDYHEAGECYQCTVIYDGALSEDGNSITGIWHIEHWRGPFAMVRSVQAVDEAVSEAVKEVSPQRDLVEPQ